ncbi:type 4a pilus biogenesis protein PilO [Leifsonia sp. AG29]|uniref:type 4a pilus biogenesis protein PilO n=1 Tax=Leifsonia sp. AG29 TaxID=2598860 RepID=UPI00131CAF1B|nr:type 4a pilus biogenesis protein PilO [Leifsonia sp. AG29]
MDKQRIVIAAIGLAIAVVLGLGYLLGIQPQLAAASAAAEQTATVLANNQASQVQLAKLKSDYAKISQFDGQLTELQRSIPSSPSLDTLLSDLRALAASTGTTISQFNPGQAVAYTPPAAPAPAAPAKASAASGSSPTPTPTPTAAAPAAPAAPKIATNPLINASNFVAIPVTIGVKGSMDGAIAFLGGLQHGSRLVLVTGFSGNEEAAAAAPAPGAKPGAPAAAEGATYTINGLVYVLASPHPASSAPSPASAAAPTPSPTPSR